MTNAEAIKWAMKNETEYDFDTVAPKTEDTNGKPIKIDTTTQQATNSRQK